VIDAAFGAAAVAIGIRPAARQAARDLPPDEQKRFVQRAMKRCSREKWLVKSQQDKADAIATSPNTLSANVRKGAYFLADVLATRKGETKLHLSKYALEASQEAAEHPEKLKITRQAKEIAQTASEVWAKESEDVTQTVCQRRYPERLEVDGEGIAISCNQPMQSFVAKSRQNSDCGLEYFKIMVGVFLMHISGGMPGQSHSDLFRDVIVREDCREGMPQ
jgi:hypothetical protein